MTEKTSLTFSLADQSFARTKSLGILNFSVHLLTALARRREKLPMTVLANRPLLETLVLPGHIQTSLHDTAADSGLGRICWDQFGVNTAARAARNEWLLLPKGFASLVRRCPVRLAVFVHDLMQEHYDRKYPSQVSRLEAAYFRSGLHASLRQAEIIFTQTEFVKAEVERYAKEHGWPPPRIVCCGRGFDRPASGVSGERRDLVVFASRFPHKLTRQAVDYLSRWQRKTNFAGSVHWIGSLPDGVALPVFPGWRLHPRLAETEFRHLLSRAGAALFFSDYEGFGLPPVEAVLAGVCPVYSDIPATREVMGGRGRLFKNDEYESFATALDRAADVGQAQLQGWSDELLKRYDWDKTAETVVAALLSRPQTNQFGENTACTPGR